MFIMKTCLCCFSVEYKLFNNKALTIHMIFVDEQINIKIYGILTFPDKNLNTRKDKFI